MGFAIGDIIEGKITGITNFGVFVDIGDGKSGMVHISEVARTYVKDIKDYVKLGDTVKVKILTIADDGKIALSMKAVQEPKQHHKREFSTPKPDNSVVWTPRKNEPATFEDMMARFKQTSEEKMSDLKRKNNDFKSRKRGTR